MVFCPKHHAVSVIHFGAFYWCIAYCWWKMCGFDPMLTLGHVSDKNQLLHCQLHLPKLVKYTVTSISLLEVNFWLLGEDNLLFIGCLVPRPHFSSWPKRFGSRGPCENVKMFPARSSRIRHWNELTERDWENAVQGLGKFIGCLCISTEAIKQSSLGGVK